MFTYYWIEGKLENYEYLKNILDLPLFKIESSFSAPVFFHTGSFVKESLKIRFIKKSNYKNIMITCNDNAYSVYEKNGFNYIFKD